ncbi:MAG: endonuclease/exonuclease/phosphatase family protein [Fibrobacteria bacterium]|nr:endonuclease/exonuclease/phosphatase family protein [Fibrobacteria bacterium]
MKKRFFIFLIMVLGTLPAFSLDLDLMSFNIKNGTDLEDWNKRKGLVFKLLSDVKPDIAGLQEVNLYQLEELIRSNPNYSSIGVGRIDGDTAGEYCPIVYQNALFDVDTSGTFWLSLTPDEPGSIGIGAVLPRIVTWARFREIETGIHFYFYNSHYSHHSDYAREQASRVIGKKIGERENQADRVILTCDCNSEENSPAMKYLMESDDSPLQFSHSFRELYPHETEAATFHRWSGKTKGSPIDYILVWGERLEVTNAHILNDKKSFRFYSDHYAITTSITITAPVSILVQPKSASVARGESAVFYINITGTEPRIQWRKNGEDIPNASGKELFITSVEAEDDSAVYDVIVSNSAGSDTSSPALLKIQNEEPVATAWDLEEQTKPYYAWSVNQIKKNKQMFFTLRRGGVALRIYDISGQSVFSKFIKAPGALFYLGHIKPGVYVISVQSPLYSGTDKLLVR